MNRRKLLITGAAGLAGGAALGSYARFIEPGRIEYTFPRHGLAGAPSFAHVSDLHLRELTGVHEDIAAEMARREPGFVVLTGDSVDRTADLPLLAEFLALLPPVPKFAILGNWEHWGGVDVKRLRQVYERADTRLLVNEVQLHEGVAIAGLDDLVGGRPEPGRIAAALPDGGARLLLAHCPAQRDSLNAASGAPRWDLVLSGHTHGGQVRVFGAAPVRPPGSGRYVAGWYRDARPALYVSRGVGTSVLPVRFGARPEVAFFS